jgi:hypothetical protein
MLEDPGQPWAGIRLTAEQLNKLYQVGASVSSHFLDALAAQGHVDRQNPHRA